MYFIQDNFTFYDKQNAKLKKNTGTHPQATSTKQKF